ncbi:MAG: hypothetical protein RTU92_02510 [Candidatus Thorarchaeota archaeon]
MVKHPRYQAMDDARQEEFPRVFKEICEGEYVLEVIPPRIPKDPIPGPRPRPTFRILDKKGKLVAHFHPNGYSECHEDSFKETHDRISESLEKIAQDALKRYEEATKL